MEHAEDDDVLEFVWQEAEKPQADVELAQELIRDGDGSDTNGTGDDVMEDSQSGDDLQPEPRNSIQSVGMARYRTQHGDCSTIGMVVEAESGWSASFDYVSCACV